MVSRVCMCLYLLSSLGTPWLLEQPASSLLERHPLFQWLCRRFDIFKIHVWLGAYGASCQKPSWIYGNRRYLLEELDLPLDRTVKRLGLRLRVARRRTRTFDADMVKRPYVYISTLDVCSQVHQWKWRTTCERVT